MDCPTHAPVEHLGSKSLHIHDFDYNRREDFSAASVNYYVQISCEFAGDEKPPAFDPGARKAKSAPASEAPSDILRILGHQDSSDIAVSRSNSALTTNNQLISQCKSLKIH